MKKYRKTLCVLSLAAIAFCASGKSFTPVKNGETATVFDANNNDFQNILNYTAKWKKESDITPSVKLVEKDNGKWALFSYSGKEGKAISRFDLDKGILTKLRGKEKVYSGIKLKIDYNGKEFDKIAVKIVFKDKTILAKPLPLEKGIREYVVTNGYRLAKHPPDWDNIEYIWIANGNPEMTFMLQKITMIEEKGKKKIKELKITKHRKIKEIFFSETPIIKDGKINSECFKNSAELLSFYKLKKKEPLKQSPLKARICYDGNDIAIETEAEFPTPPKADIKKHDEAVWQDEGIEYFFSPWLDNDKKIQFATNANGTCFDYIRDYDNAAASIINIIPWTLQHNKEMEYKDSIWKTKIAFSLKELKIDLFQNRIVGFQLSQNYHPNKYENENFRTLSWAPSNKFPKAESFGFLVFNKKPFGPGEIAIDSIKSFEKNEKLMDIEINISLKNLKPGDYKLKRILSAADFTVYNQEEDLKVTEKDSKVSIKMTSIKTLNGLYTLCLCLKNKNGEIKASAVNFENSTPLKDMFGKKIFCPTPKKVEWKNGVFNAGDCNSLLIPENASDRTKRTAEIFAEQLKGFAASEYNISRNDKIENNSIILKIAKHADFNGKKEALKNEGYCINATPENVTITGADEAGLYYACVTFIQLIKMPMQFKDSAPVQCVEILDWPDVPNRMMRLPHPWTFKGKSFKENRKIEFLMDWIEKFVANNKYNRLCLDISHLTKFKRRPEFNGSERIYSLEDLERLGRFARDRFVEIIPAFQVGGHAGWWLLQYHPEMREKGYRNMSDYTHPEHNKIVFDCMLDIIEAIKAKYATPKSDECWHGKHPEEIPDEKLRGKSRSQAFLDFHVETNNFLKKHGARMLIFEDMLNPRHNGKRYDLYKITDKLPKDILIGQWSGSAPDLTVEYFTDKGFEVWGSATNYWTYGPKGKKSANGYGVAAYGLGLGWKLYRQSVSYSADIQFWGADIAWNMKRENDPGLIDDLASGKIVALREMSALEPNPNASEKIIPFDITKSLDSSWEKVIQKKLSDTSLLNAPSGQCDIGNIPMNIGPKEKNCAIFGGNSAGAELSIKGKFSSLIFLHTGFITQKAVKEFRGHWRHWIYGYPVGDYFVHYSDGSQEKLPIRLKRNIDWMDVNPLFRATVENRYIMPAKLSNGNYSFLYQWEWVNPHPEKEIEKISYQDDKNFDFNLLLFAISGRKVKN